MANSRPESTIPESPRARSDRARRTLRRAGFQRIGFASGVEPPGAERLEEWVHRGFDADMSWLARTLEKRRDIRRVLPDARGVIVLAVPYSADGSSRDRHAASGAIPSAATDASRGEIAAYARGDDYHRVLERRLIRACRDLRAEVPGSYRWYVDTGPVAEKAWARAAGIGWIGKNTCSIDADHGSRFLLAVILTSVDFAPDPPATDHCGSCRLCLDACPTDAFPEPYVLDARRCISYLTIEHRGEIAPELEPGLGNLIFGCDICQDVCPWNRARSESTRPEAEACDAELAPWPDHETRLERLAALSEPEFDERYRRSPLRRPRLRGFLRNVAIALGNSRRPELQAPLEALLARPEVAEDPALTATVHRALKRLSACTMDDARRADPKGNRP